jgi:hypothetical protein
MKRLLMACLLALASTLCAAQEAAPAEARQILVMLHLPAPHFRPDQYYPSNYREDAGRPARRRLAEALAREYGLTIIDDWAMPTLNIDCFRMAEPAGAQPGKIVEALSRDARVKWAQPVSSFAAQGNDPLYAVQPAALEWRLADMRKVATGRNVLVAVIDSGVESAHPDLAGQVQMQENFVGGQAYAAEEHGTAVAGVIAARAGNGVGIEGVAPDARLMALRACSQQATGKTRCDSFSLAKALNYALTHHAQVINLSLSGPPDRLMRELIDVAIGRGVKVVGAVDPDSADGGFPANHPGVFAVAAGGSVGAGEQVLFAPGQDIPTTATGARWGMVSGSSYSAAHISGMMALLSELRPGLALARIRDGVVASQAAPRSGLDVCATVARITGKCACVCSAPDAARVVRSN